MKPDFNLELCIDSVASARVAERIGAKRVELCSDLFGGGCTPSAGLLSGVLGELKEVETHVMIRPRPGDFCYDGDEFEIMLMDMRLAVSLGAKGIVVGILKPDGTVDVERMKEFMHEVKAQTFLVDKEIEVTFHRAFDVTRDPFEALETLIELGVTRILTSGQEANLFEGGPLVAELVKRAGDRVTIMAAGGISEKNFARLRELVGAQDYHMRLSEKTQSAMEYRKGGVYMGGLLRASEFEGSQVSETRLHALLEGAIK